MENIMADWDFMVGILFMTIEVNLIVMIVVKKIN